MERKAVSELMLTLPLTSMSTLAFDIQPVKTEPKTWIVDDDGQCARGKTPRKLGT